MKKLMIIFVIIGLFFATGCTGGVNNNKDDTSKQEEVDLDEVVKFNDVNLEKIVRRIVGIESGDILGTDMQNVYSLSLNNREGDQVVSDLTGLEYAINLESISILYNDIKSLDPISNLPNLTYFNLSYSTLEENPNLNNPKLLTMSFIEVEIDNVDFVSNLETLTSITLSRTGISDITSLKNLDSLENVNLYGNNISDISALGEKSNLVDLNLQGNQVSDISYLSSDVSLEYIVLSYNHISDLSALMNLNSLYELRIYEELDAKIASRTQINQLAVKGVDVYYHE